MRIKVSPETAGAGAVLDFHTVSITGGVGPTARFSPPAPSRGRKEAEEK